MGVTEICSDLSGRNEEIHHERLGDISQTDDMETED
jgi:hypothetical protein